MPVVVVDNQIVVVEQDRPVNITVQSSQNTVAVTDMSIGETVTHTNIVDLVEEPDSIVVQGVGIQGAKGDKGDTGSAGAGSDTRYVHTQAIPNRTWDIVHNLNREVAVVRLQDTTGAVYDQPDYTIIDLNHLTIDLYYATGGKAVIL